MKKILAYMCLLAILSCAVVTGGLNANALYSSADLESSIFSASEWTKNNIKPLENIGSAEADISIVALKRAGIDYNYHAYLDGLDPIAEQYGDKYEDMQRGLMAVIALGGNSGYFGGRDLAGDCTYNKSLNGVMEYAGALSASNTGAIELPSELREEYIKNILSYQDEDGGFGDVFSTAAVIIALSKNNNDTEYDVSYIDGRGAARISGGRAVYDALNYLSKRQSADGDFYTLIDTAAVSMAVDAIGISENDKRIVKNDNTIMDGLLTYQKSDGSFSNDYNKTDKLATAYAMSAMVSRARVLQKKSQFFNFLNTDTIRITSSSKTSTAKPTATAKSSTSTRTPSTTKPRATTRPKTSAKPSSSPSGSAKPRITPAPTKRPDLVGPAQLIGPLPTMTADPFEDLENNNQTTGFLSKAAPIAAAIIGVLAIAAIILLAAMKRRIWIFKDTKSNKKRYRAKRHRKGEEHRKYEERRRYTKRGKYKNRHN